MALKSLITDKKTNISASVVNGKDEEHALVVATRPLKTYDNEVLFFINDEYGADMNKSAVVGGTPELVHNGIDTALWTGTDLIDNVIFDSTERPYEGARSIKFSTWSNTGDLIQITRPAGNLDLSGYVALTMWMNVNNNWSDSDSVTVYGWDSSTNTQVGIEVPLEHYFDNNQDDTWQKIVIPLDDMELVSKTIDSIRFLYKQKNGNAANFYIDKIQFEETGGIIEYVLKPAKGTRLHVYTFTFLIASDINGTLTDATMPLIPYDSLLGVALPVGIVYKREVNGETVFSEILRSMADFMQIAGTEVVGTGSDGANTWISLKATHTEPFMLNPETEDKLIIRIQDDLSSLLRFRVSAGCKVEQR